MDCGQSDQDEVLRNLFPKKFNLKDLKTATNNFQVKLGSGGSGLVFKGVLEDKTEVAVKRVDTLEHGKSLFLKEVEAIANVKHVNLVGLRGYCNEPDIPAVGKGITFYIVYDLLANGSLDNWIFKDSGLYLPWTLRYRVAVEVAKALVYLHHECSKPILHLDIKPGNILLDNDFHAVLSDFGMSKVMKNEYSNDKLVRGTPGYIAPEWFLGNHQMNAKFDIFGYGKVLLDLFFGVRYVCLNKNGVDVYNKNGNSKLEQDNFYDFMEEKLKQGTIMDYMDKRIDANNEEVNRKEVTCLVCAALVCIQSDPDKRAGDMEEVMAILKGTNTNNHFPVHFQRISTMQQARSLAPRVVKPFDVFASREATKNEIIQALMEENTKLIGVYGFEGMGKTTLMEQVCEEIASTNPLIEVVFAMVSAEPNLIEIQSQIAESLGMSIQEETLQLRANRLSAMLSQKRNIILVLDDLQVRLELAKLGVIPCGQGPNICKVVIVSRGLDVCDSMATTINIKVEELLKEESRKLFLNNVGHIESDTLRTMSVDLASECKGLPTAILTFAMALRNKKEDMWPAIIVKKRKTLFWGKFDDLQKTIIDRLDPLEARIDRKVCRAKDNGDVVDRVVTLWLQNVSIVRLKVAKWCQKVGDFLICIQGQSASLRLCEKSRETLLVVYKLIEEGENFGEISTPAPIPPQLLEHFHEFTSRKPTRMEVIKALMDNDLVGVYGMGGVGKTILAKQICEKALRDKLFEKVILVQVSQELNLQEIQRKIAESLGMTNLQETEPARTNRLSQRLHQEQKILIILDDLWAKLELATLGIVPCCSCKVLIMSRNSDVCHSMKTTKNILLKLISRTDSLELFMQELAVSRVISNDMLKMSEEMVNKCDGLPLAIVTLARHLRGKEESVWNAVNSLLKKSVHREGMSIINSSTKRTYDFLERSELRKCFLLCALFPEKHEITMETLIGYVMGESLLGHPDTLAEAMDYLIIMVDTLVSTGLLVKCNDKVKMHNIVRDTAISIASDDDNKSIIKAGVGLTEWPEVHEWCLRLSLMRNEICRVPDSLGPPKLITLSLSNNMLLRNIPRDFFIGMRHLGTLDLSKTNISSLPRSLRSLMLRTLYLDDCEQLQDISMIIYLEKLEILSLQNSRMSLATARIWRLRKLKMLVYNN